MKQHLIVLLLAISAILRAEDITVYQCVRSETKPEEMSIGAKLADFTSGQKSLQTIYDDFKKTSWTAEPFYGYIVPYIFKDSGGKLFVVHFEFKDGHKFLGKGDRFAIEPLKAVTGSKTLYTGDPYVGSSITDEHLLKQLRAISVTKKP